MKRLPLVKGNAIGTHYVCPYCNTVFDSHGPESPYYVAPYGDGCNNCYQYIVTGAQEKAA